jgi:hypothetical protein
MLRTRVVWICLPVVVLFLAATAVQADTMCDFESPTYTTGALAGQDGWFTMWGGTQTVIDTDASQGSQSVLGGGAARALNDAYAATDTVYIACDVKRTSSTYLQLYDGSAWNSHRLMEFGFDSSMPGFYAYNSGGAAVEGSTPNTDRWVTIWAKLYDAGSGNVNADVGWCELNQTPFVDGQRISGYDALDYALTTVINGGSGGFDNLRVSTIPEPSALALLTTSLLGLLAYAWRRRRCVPS